MTVCRWCAERIAVKPADQPGPQPEFCSDTHRAAYARRRATAPPGWEEFPHGPDGPMSMAMWEAEKRLYANYPERTAPSWLADLYDVHGRPPSGTSCAPT